MHSLRIFVSFFLFHLSLIPLSVTKITEPSIQQRQGQTWMEHSQIHSPKNSHNQTKYSPYTDTLPIFFNTLLLFPLFLPSLSLKPWTIKQPSKLEKKKNQRDVQHNKINEEDCWLPGVGAPFLPSLIIHLRPFPTRSSTGSCPHFSCLCYQCCFLYRSGYHWSIACPFCPFLSRPLIPPHLD